MQQYYEVTISADSKQQADKILNSLIEKKLATNGQSEATPARFPWKDQIKEVNYVTVTLFTTEAKKQALVKDIEANSLEGFPLISFVPIEANSMLTAWIEQTLK